MTKYKQCRENGITPFCRKEYKLIENYELAKADNFDSKKWHLHHRLENYWSSATLKRKRLYYNLNPEALIWLPADEHNSDYCISILTPEKTKWHKRMYEKGNNMRRDIGIKQSEDYNGYQKEYQKIYYREHQNEGQDYLLHRRYRSYSLEKLRDMLDKKLKSRCTMNDEKRNRLIDILKEIIDEKENNYDGYTPLKGTYKIQEEIENMNREIHNKGL